MNDTADVRIHYCKSKKHTGKPIIVNPTGSEQYDTDNIEMSDVNIRVKYNNAVSKEKSSGATSILEVWENKPIIDNHTLEYKSTRTKDVYYGCISCDKKFPVGEKRIKWRLQLIHSNQFHNGSFWTEQCPACATKTCDYWIDSLKMMKEFIKNE
jgi:hypothetical protein